MGYAAPIANAVNFDFTETGYSAPAGGAILFDFSAATVIEIPCEEIRLLSLKPLFLPFSIPSEQFRLAQFSPTYIGPGVVASIDSEWLALEGLAPGLQVGIGIDATGLYLMDASPGYGRTVSLLAEYFTLVDPLTGLSALVSPPAEEFFIYESGPYYPIWLFMPSELLRLQQRQPNYVWTIKDLSVAQTVYTFTLTGSPDVVIPVSSIQIRRRDGDPTYISVVVPGFDYAAAIAERSTAGEMIIKKGYRLLDGSINMQEIARADLESIRIDRGGRNASVTISGHRTVENYAPKTVFLEGASYRNFSDGKRRYRCAVNLWLQPGDTVEVNGEPFTAGMISYTIGSRQEVMEIGEA